MLREMISIRRNQNNKKFRPNRLKTEEERKEYEDSITKELNSITQNENVDQARNAVKTAMIRAAKGANKGTTEKQQPWFDDQCREGLEMRNRLI
ncbi:unnamed protein product [Acanthoscelides obtectus]|uniref:Uncharacterized protein n=1 Tax=Acanthoscelides obtectus TaxID=200917 RepID=A0A9P0PZ81_ACAOB|nr:unnamed protein product [Acanthoscelides obtectus]CAK1682197.1 hypothetical protein AOBTE_LOCUS33478 [Acanthoscelides obtectus]